MRTHLQVLLIRKSELLSDRFKKGKPLPKNAHNTNGYFIDRHADLKELRYIYEADKKGLSTFLSV